VSECKPLLSGKAHLKDEGDPKPAVSATAATAAVNGDVSSGGGGEKSKGPAAFDMSKLKKKKGGGGSGGDLSAKVGRCRLAQSNPC
jgi:hypothetical protein